MSKICVTFADVMVTGRFAPSPTGRMHLGNVFAALISYLSCKSQGGEWVLRIEDIDPQRSRPEYAALVRQDLRWLGLDWDREYVQSERFHLYEEALERLRAQNLLLPSYRNRKERTASGAPQVGDIQGFISERKPATAILMPDGEPLILRRSDDAWAYQLAVVVDDALNEITEVVRGRDLLPSVRYHHHLQSLLGYPSPEYKHFPLLVNPEGQRLCKRDKSLDMSVLCEHYTAEEIIGRLAYYAGQIPVMEPISVQELVRLFDWHRLPQNDIVCY